MVDFVYLLGHQKDNDVLIALRAFSCVDRKISIKLYLNIFDRSPMGGLCCVNRKQKKTLRLVLPVSWSMVINFVYWIFGLLIVCIQTKTTTWRLLDKLVQHNLKNNNKGRELNWVMSIKPNNYISIYSIQNMYSFAVAGWIKAKPTLHNQMHLYFEKKTQSLHERSVVACQLIDLMIQYMFVETWIDIIECVRKCKSIVSNLFLCLNYLKMHPCDVIC